MANTGYFKGIYSISACIWLLLGLCSIFSIKKFIVRRYEEETDLLKTLYFKEHLPFAQYLPGFLSSGLYAAHLLICVWGWRFYGKKKIFRDIENREFITQHFSKTEIFRVKRTFFIAVIVVFHAIGMDIIDWIWPGKFD